MINFYQYHNSDLDMYEVVGYLLSGIYMSGAPDGDVEIDINRDYTPILHIIKTDPCMAFFYASYIMDSRWVEAEPTIMKDIFWRVEYRERFEL